MSKRYYISEEQVTEIQHVRKTNKNKSVENRLKALLLHAKKEKCGEIAVKTGFSKSYISKLVSKYCNEGLCAIVENHYTGNYRKLSFDEEVALLEQFREKAIAGQMVEISEIKLAYEKATGCSLDNNHGQIYRVLKRHDWRKIMLRSKHQNKASDEAIDASKKLTMPSKMRWKILQVGRFD